MKRQGTAALQALPAPVQDCPDGLARCEDGVVSVSRLATLPQPCNPAARSCTCPWEGAGRCERACAAEGVEVVMERGRAMAQLCGPAPDAGARFRDATQRDLTQVPECDEGQRYRCSGAVVVSCEHRAEVCHCARGCGVEGAGIDQDGADAGAACDILCMQ